MLSKNPIPLYIYRTEFSARSEQIVYVFLYMRVRSWSLHACLVAPSSIKCLIQNQHCNRALDFWKTTSQIEFKMASNGASLDSISLEFYSRNNVLIMGSDINLSTIPGHTHLSTYVLTATV